MYSHTIAFYLSAYKVSRSSSSTSVKIPLGVNKVFRALITSVRGSFYISALFCSQPCCMQVPGAWLAGPHVICYLCGSALGCPRSLTRRSGHLPDYAVLLVILRLTLQTLERLSGRAIHWRNRASHTGMKWAILRSVLRRNSSIPRQPGIFDYDTYLP